jgi:hypothetical protein
MKPQTATLKILPTLKTEPNGHCFSNLAADGVLRIYHSDIFEVIDAARLSPVKIKDYLDRLPFD